jgi:enamine deaminase RidA (YjgF/YER057c/UK114 family)
VVSARVYLARFEADYAAMNAIWAEEFPPGTRPTRVCIGVTALALGAVVEVEVVARRP